MAWPAALAWRLANGGERPMRVWAAASLLALFAAAAILLGGVLAAA